VTKVKEVKNSCFLRAFFNTEQPEFRANAFNSRQTASSLALLAHMGSISTTPLQIFASFLE